MSKFKQFRLRSQNKRQRNFFTRYVARFLSRHSVCPTENFVIRHVGVGKCSSIDCNDAYVTFHADEIKLPKCTFYFRG